MAIVQKGGNKNNATSATTVTVTYTPVNTKNVVIVFLTVNALINIQQVKTNDGTALTAGPTTSNGSAHIYSFYASGTPAGTTSFVATWAVSAISSITVEEYEGPNAINASLAGNTATGISTTATISVTTEDANDWIVCGLADLGNTLTGSVGNARQQVTAGTAARHVLIDNTIASANICTCSATLTSSAWAAVAIELRLIVNPVNMDWTDPNSIQVADFITTGKTQGLLSLMISESNYGDSVASPPDLAKFISPLYDVYYDQKPLSAFALYAFGDGMHVSESTYGDYAEQPPILPPGANSQILMSYSGYRISKSAMQDPNDESHFPISVVVIVYNDLTNDAENQLAMPNYLFGDGMQVSESDYGDYAEVPPIIPRYCYDDYAIQQKSNQVLYVDQIDFQDNVELITLPRNTWEQDLDNQKSNAWQFNSDTVSDEAVEIIVLPYNDFSTDAVNQLPSPLGFSSDNVSDEGVEIIIIQNLSSWLDYEVNQISNSLWFSSDILPDDGVEIITLPYRDLTLEVENQLSNQVNYKDHLSDEGVELITIPYRDLTLDADQQLLEPLQFSMDDVLDAGVEIIIIPPFNPANLPMVEDQQNIQGQQLVSDDIDRSNLIVLPYNDWTLEVENERANPEYIVDKDVLDTGVEYITLPANIWDTDADSQLSQLQYNTDREVLDNCVEYITIPVVAYDTEADNQLSQLPYVVDKDVIDLGVEYIIIPVEDLIPKEDQISNSVWFSKDTITDEGVEYITLPFNDWTLDVENKIPTPGYFTDRDLSDAGVELVQVGFIFSAWEQDLDNNLAQVPFYTDREVSDLGVENIILPYRDFTSEAEQQKMQAEYYKDHISDEGVEIIIIPPTVNKLSAYDTDGENQIPYVLGFSSDNLSDEGVEYITLPPGSASQVLMSYTGYRISKPAMFSISDEIIEKFSIPVVSYDTDADQQKLQGDYSKDHLSDEAVELIIIPPVVNQLYAYDTDADNQKSNQVQFSSDNLSDEGVEKIFAPPPPTANSTYDDHIEDQFLQASYQGIGTDQGQDYTYFIVLPNGVVIGWDYEINQIPYPVWYRDLFEGTETLIPIAPRRIIKKPIGRIRGLQATTFIVKKTDI
jgi:hypothetical protein